MRGLCTSQYVNSFPIVQEDPDEPQRTCVLAQLSG
ncbi:hypothetical protein STVIR_1087 [Streptomyces viridochromogenes Tue57]|uniref:Uncharacterized protein n=1 Tax=Streptomyces viridochromogenes Tue57 TaxID=1160705 RepID=L8PK62_STRVR|nr:hypothetical protein STVIR_1087 [Streptomyces viridochromogenes Tue57]